MSMPISQAARGAPNPAMNAEPAGAGSGKTNIWNARLTTTHQVSLAESAVRPCAETM